MKAAAAAAATATNGVAPLVQMVEACAVVLKGSQVQILLMTCARGGDGYMGRLGMMDGEQGIYQPVSWSSPECFLGGRET